MTTGVGYEHCPQSPVILGGGSGDRAASLREACLILGNTPPRFVSFREFLADSAILVDALRGARWLHIDTPDQDVCEMAALYRAGASKAGELGHVTLPEDSEHDLASGAIGSPAQLAFGLEEAVAQASSIAARHGATCTTSARDLARSFDKSRTHACLRAAGIPVPAMLEDIADFATLESAMDRARTNRAFVKLRHGAAAAGIVALARNGKAWRAVTTARCEADGQMRASRRVRNLTDPDAIAHLIEQLAPLGVHAESWIPKMGVDGLTVDLRLVVIDGEVSTAILRGSRHPITNLHLGGRRMPVEALVNRIGEAGWARICDTAKDVARLFPDTLSLGVDIAVSADGRRHFVLEANVFGHFVKDAGEDRSSVHEQLMRHMMRRGAGEEAVPQAA